MPYYDYQCSNSHRFELKQGFDADTVTTCPTCETEAKRLINLVPVHFKGSGFYVNDYGKKGSESESSKSDDGKADTGEGKADTSEGKAKSSEGKAESKSGSAVPKEPATAGASGDS